MDIFYYKIMFSDFFQGSLPFLYTTPCYNVVLLLILYCLLRKLLVLYNFLKARIPLEETGQDTTETQG